MSEITAGFAMCGSFCTFSKVLPSDESAFGEGHAYCADHVASGL